MEEMITIPKKVYESEKKMRFFGVDSQDVYGRKFNIFIGVSITNKKLTSDMIFNYLEWALRNTKDRVAVIIADDLNIINHEILDKFGKDKSVKRARKVGDEFEENFKKEISKFNKEEQEKVFIYKWRDVEKDKDFLKIRDFVDTQYGKDAEFRSAILYFIKKFLRKKGKLIEDSRKLDLLATYVIGELPTLLQGIELDNVKYDLCMYPTYFESGMSQFILDIHNEELEFGKKVKFLLKNKAGLIEAWLD